eukprot:scaffold109698_cov60-Phaeocystis_antarctica.AAC.4
MHRRRGPARDARRAVEAAPADLLHAAHPNLNPSPSPNPNPNPNPTRHAAHPAQRPGQRPRRRQAHRPPAWPKRPFGTAPARLLRLLRAALGALGGVHSQGRGQLTGRPATASGARARRLQSHRFHRLWPSRSSP